MDNRIDKELWFLKLAKVIAERSTCLRRHYGSIIVNDYDEIISTGYNGAPRGQHHCEKCYRIEHKIPAGSHYEKCFSIHAECNAIIQAGKDARGCTIYINGYNVISNNDDKISYLPCLMCSRIIVNSGLDRIIVPDESGESYIMIEPTLAYLSANLKEGM